MSVGSHWRVQIGGYGINITDTPKRWSHASVGPTDTLQLETIIQHALTLNNTNRVILPEALDLKLLDER
jgi:hypothetical protein